MQDETPFAMTLVMAVCALLSWLSQSVVAVRLSSEIRRVSSGEKNNE
ncbi:hypothetical protein HDI70_003463 [Salmonella enterica]|nr:hypothetical protein [Salmonella enterica]